MLDVTPPMRYNRHRERETLGELGLHVGRSRNNDLALGTPFHSFHHFTLDNQHFIWYNTPMEKRTQRSPQELIAEQQAKLERMQVRQAHAEAKSNPALSPLMDEKGDLAKEIREAKKLLGSGPQSADARIEKHQDWIDKIEVERTDAGMVLESAESRLLQINAEIASAIQGIVEAPKENALEA